MRQNLHGVESLDTVMQLKYQVLLLKDNVSSTNVFSCIANNKVSDNKDFSHLDKQTHEWVAIIKKCNFISLFLVM